jgi:uncharacterized protein (TIGR02186 family)
VKRAAALALAFAAILAAAPDAPARADQVIADLSRQRVTITTGFAGSDVLLFGAIETPSDVVVIVRGPERDVVVRRKERIAGVWINAVQATFAATPTFYAVASSGPLDKIVPPHLARQEEIGAENLRLQIREKVDAAQAAAYRKALIRNFQRDDLYADDIARVTFLGQRLFRAEIRFPSNVPTGTYTVKVLQIKNGQVVSAFSRPLPVSKAGMSARVSEFANRQAVYYGLIAIALAVAAGWGAGQIFRRP